MINVLCSLAKRKDVMEQSQMKTRMDPADFVEPKTLYKYCQIDSC